VVDNAAKDEKRERPEGSGELELTHPLNRKKDVGKKTHVATKQDEI
jgi:hypothetical protein